MSRNVYWADRGRVTRYSYRAALSVSTRDVRGGQSFEVPERVPLHRGGGIEESRNERDDDGGYRASYTPNVQYRYVAEGVTIIGSRIAHVERGYNSPSKAEAELALYPIDSAVVAYFSPQKPSEAVLVRNAPRAIIFLCAGIIILAVDGVAVLKR